MKQNNEPHRPELFKAIIETDNHLSILLAMPAIPFDTWRLIHARREMTRGAERLLQWNHDKGNTR